MDSSLSILDTHYYMETLPVEDTPPTSSIDAWHAPSTYPHESYYPSFFVHMFMDDKFY